MGPLLAIPMSLEVLGLGGQFKPIPIFAQKQFANMEFPASLRVLGLLLFLVLGIWIAVPRGDSRLNIPWLGKRKAWLGILLFFPLVVLFLVSFYKPLYVVGRYDTVAFPAYALLLGLALAKVQQMRKDGPFFASIIAVGLMIPIGTKLVLYYHAPSPRHAQATARVLHTHVNSDDTVVLTGWGGLTVLYYLTRLNYHCEDGRCQNDSTGRGFPCRFFPRFIEQSYFAGSAYNPGQVSRSLEATREDVQDYLSRLRSRTGRLWVVLEGGLKASTSIRREHLHMSHRIGDQRLRRRQFCSCSESYLFGSFRNKTPSKAAPAVGTRPVQS